MCLPFDLEISGTDYRDIKTNIQVGLRDIL